MAENLKGVTPGGHTITAHLSIKGAEKAVEFYQKAFGAEVRALHKTPNGMVMHASLRIGDSTLMLADDFPNSPAPAPTTLGGSPVVLNIYVENVDVLFNQAVAAGAKVLMPLANMFWGDRYGQISDPFGHIWALGTHVEDVAPDEMERRSKAFFTEMSKQKGA